MGANLTIRAIGAGGAGANVIKRLAALGLPGLELAAIDADLSALEDAGVENAIAIGGSHTDDMGTGGDANLAKEAAIAHYPKLVQAVRGADVLIIISGFGGGTGSVVAPILSKIASEMKKKPFVVSFSFAPLGLEGAERGTLATLAQNYIRKRSNLAVSLPNDIILARAQVPVEKAFSIANAHVVKSVAAIAKMLSKSGTVNIDFPTLKKVFPKTGEKTFLAFGMARDNSVENALESLAASPLLGKYQNLKAGSLLISLTCGSGFEMNKMQLLLESAAQRLGVKGRVGFGVVTNEKFGDKIEVCAMGTIESAELPPEPAAMPPKISEHSIVANEKAAESAEEEEKREEEQAQEQSEEMNSQLQASGADGNVAPPPSASDVGPAPVPAEPEEAPRKKRRGFFGFGRGKDEKEEAAAAQAQQAEFKFMEMSQQRGFFEDTPPNLRNDVDLDVPTYLRKGIKITL